MLTADLRHLTAAQDGLNFSHLDLSRCSEDIFRGSRLLIMRSASHKYVNPQSGKSLRLFLQD